MKSTLLRLSALLLTFSVGISLPFLLKQQQPSIEPVPLSAVGSVVSCECPGALEPMKGGYIVISVPDDDAFYLGKRKVDLDEIPGAVRRMLGKQPFDNQIIYIKVAKSVRFETVSLITGELRNANIRCIRFVLDKKKGGAFQPKAKVETK